MPRPRAAARGRPSRLASSRPRARPGSGQGRPRGKGLLDRFNARLDEPGGAARARRAGRAGCPSTRGRPRRGAASCTGSQAGRVGCAGSEMPPRPRQWAAARIAMWRGAARRAVPPRTRGPAARGHAARPRRPAGQGTVFTPRLAGPAVVARRIILEAMRASSDSRSGWRVGTTDDPRRSRRERRSPPTWSDWDAGSAGMARAIEGRLAGLGMRRDRAAARGSGGAAGRHVYAFRG